ncbi:MAG: hypothetical protein KGV44_07695 [Flavobacteriaceae bacterium]|nr:hypothetical protein [Flavobacteriaceae bacterium]
MKKAVSIAFCVFFGVLLFAQKTPKRGDYRLLFYNVENLFDAKNDSLKLDDDFTPEGKIHWTFAKYKKKINRIAQVVMAVGEWEVPEIVGLCEVENRFVLEGLTKFSPLKKFKYEIVHYESPDERGIDVALLYQKQKFEVLHSQPIRIDLHEDKTRDILYVKGVTATTDTLHIFVNHFPSKYGGVLQTLPKRKKVAEILRTKTDSLLQKNPLAKIIIMGDFNDEPTSVALAQSLGAKTIWQNTDRTALYNLSAEWEQQQKGTHKYHGIWSVLDQIIVSNGMFKGQGYLFTSPENTHIFKAKFLLEDDKNGGVKPFRTLNGMKYNDGFSDHLPIYLDLWLK